MALWLARLELGPDAYPLLESARSLLRRPANVKNSGLLETGDSQHALRQKMLAVCVGCEARLDVMLAALLGDLASDNDARIKLIERSELGAYFRSRSSARMATTASRGLQDFVIELFKTLPVRSGSRFQAAPVIRGEGVHQALEGQPIHARTLEHLSAQCADILQIDDKLHRWITAV